MTLANFFLFCFAVGAVWSIVTLLFGGLHFGHGHHGVHGHSHTKGCQAQSAFLGTLVHPNSLAAFAAWFGGVGYLLTRHTGWRLWADLAFAALAGSIGASILASFLRFLQSKDEPLHPADYQMIGVLGKVSAPIRPGGVGEVIYLRDGARKPVAARSETGVAIDAGEEVIVTCYEHGIAQVRTWAAMVPQSTLTGSAGKALQKDAENVQ